MSDKVSKIFLIILFFMAQLNLMAQVNDSIKVEYTVENTEKSDYKFKERYNYLQRRMIAEKSLFKISLLDFNVNVNDQGQYLTHHTRGNVLSYERKISPSFSFLYQNLNYLTISPFLFAGTPQVHILNSSSIGGRYYYEQRKKIRQGKSANNFSANYLSLYFDNLVQFRVNYLKSEVDQSTSKPSINILYGIQRRLGQFGYFDWNAGLRYDEINYNSALKPIRKTPLAFFTNFSIGLGF
jgi:hypothetical protein